MGVVLLLPDSVHIEGLITTVDGFPLVPLWVVKYVDDVVLPFTSPQRVVSNNLIFIEGSHRSIRLCLLIRFIMPFLVYIVFKHVIKVLHYIFCSFVYI